MLWIGAASLLLMVIMALFYGPTDNWIWDPSYYYAQLASPLIDHDIDFRNQTQTGGQATLYTERGLQGSPYPIGPSLLWSPAFLAVHIPVSLLFPDRATGYTFPYIAIVSFASLLYGFAGLYLIYHIARLFAGARLAVFSALLTLAATPLAFYIFRQPIMAHTTNLCAVALILLSYLLLSRGSLPIRYSGFILGVFLGINFLTRWTGLFMGVFPLAYFGEVAWRIYRQRNGSWRALLIQLGIFTLSFGLTISPQIVLWYGLYGRILVFPQAENAFVGSWVPVFFLNILFDTNRGMLFWTPFIFLGLLGLFWAPERRLKFVLIVYCLLQVLLISYKVDWASGGMFGQRYLLEMLPVTALGFVFLAQRLRRAFPGRWLVWIGVGAGLLLVIQQLVLMYAVEHAIEPGWLDLQMYYNRQPLGVAFQIQAFWRLLTHPSLWLASRPYVALDRQTLVVSLARGAISLRTLAIPLIGVLLAPLIALLIFGLQRIIPKMRALPVIAGSGLCLTLTWSLYLLTLV
jgi:hypothetical protein